MTSSAVTGGRRWTAPRRSSFTVLGKIPKPINLPSQRSENRGLDPNVEIVPKNRSSFSASNAWGSSIQSPNADGSTTSPSFLSGRPSSGGSGTRPSTAGSDRGLESSTNAWGPNSRPSSASGPLKSNQAPLTSSRPHSAEPRPLSSHLSRFAEPLSENSAWGGTGTLEKVGVRSSKNDGFSLTSGDFPTLGSDKNDTRKTGSEDDGPHSRPGSSSSIGAPVKNGNALVNASERTGIVNSQRNENHPYAEDGSIWNSVEKWQNEPPQYMQPQNLDGWHGPPLGGPPGGVWFRGHPGGPHYGTPVPPGNFPMEPFPFYRPQAQAGAQPGPLAVGGPRGHYPPNRDHYRPHMPEPYIRPSVPIRPGFYHGPVTYDGFYAPPINYSNPNEQDIPYMGMAAGPPVHSNFSNQNTADANNLHGRSNGYGSTGKTMVSEQAETVHSHDNIGPAKVILKQHNWNRKDEEQRWEHDVTTGARHIVKEDHNRASSWDDEWEVDHKSGEDMNSRAVIPGEKVSSSNFDYQQEYSSSPGRQKFHKSAVDVKPVHENSTELDIATPASSGMKQLFPVNPKDCTLIQKIEGLNAKARASDGKHDVSFVSRKEVQKNRSNVRNTEGNFCVTEAGISGAYFDSHHASGVVTSNTLTVVAEAGDMNLEAAATTGPTNARRTTHGKQGRGETRAKAKFIAQEVDGRQKKSVVADTLKLDFTNSESSLRPHGQARHTLNETGEKPGSHLQSKDEGESVMPMFDPSDSEAQRAKMRELARQKAKQLQEEEEERTREQKAKARAKLEELNRRTQKVEVATQKLVDDMSEGAMQLKQAEPKNQIKPMTIGGKSGALATASAFKDDTAGQIGKCSTDSVEKTIGTVETLKDALEEPVVIHSLPSGQEHIRNTNASLQVRDNSPRQKQFGYKQKQNISSENTVAELPVSSSSAETPRNHIDAVVHRVASAEVVNHEVSLNSESSCVIAESLPQQRRKNNRGGKNKQKLEAFSVPIPPSQVPKETSPAKSSSVSGKIETSEPKVDNSIQLVGSKDASRPSEQQHPLPGDEAHVKVNTHWRPQQSRKMAKSGEAVVWAPVRSQNRTEVAIDSSHRTVVDTSSPAFNSDPVVHNSPKSRRAEIERYVPKPAAKEMAQQGSIQRSMSPAFNQTGSDVATGKVGPGSQSTENTQAASSSLRKAGSSGESRSGEARQNKQAKAHGAWRQRVSAESTPVERFHDDGLPVEKPSDCGNMKPSVHLSKEQADSYNEWNSNDGWNDLDNPEVAHSAALPVKDLGTAARGKRHPFKGPRGTVRYPDFDGKNLNSGEGDKTYRQSPALEVSQMDGERSISQWQPKTQGNVTHNQRGSRPNGGKIGDGKITRQSTSQHEAEIVENTSHADSVQTIAETSNVENSRTLEHQDTGRERKVALPKGQVHSPKHGPVNPESASATVDSRHEQRSSSGLRKNGNQSSRFGRGHESCGEWSSAGQDGRQHNPPAVRERQRHSSHYEYQPVGPHNHSRMNNSEVQDNNFHNMDSRPRDRGQGHPKRRGGNFYGRQGFSAGVDHGYE